MLIILISYHLCLVDCEEVIAPDDGKVNALVVCIF